MRRILPIALLVAGLWQAPIAAQVSPPLYYGADGSVKEAQGTFCPDATKCGGGVGGSVAPPSTEGFVQLALAANTRAQIASPLTSMVNGIVCTASASNTASVLVGGSAVTVAENGTGNGYAMPAGQSYAAAVSTTAGLYFISSAAAVITCHGN